MNGFVQFLGAVILVEATVQGFKYLYDPEKRPWFVAGKAFDWERFVGIIPNLLAQAIGILVAVLGNLDLLKVSQLSLSVPAVGWVMTGVVIGRGTNYAFDLVKLLKGTLTSLQVKSPEK